MLLGLSLCFCFSKTSSMQLTWSHFRSLLEIIVASCITCPSLVLPARSNHECVNPPICLYLHFVICRQEVLLIHHAFEILQGLTWWEWVIDESQVSVGYFLSRLSAAYHDFTLRFLDGGTLRKSQLLQPDRAHCFILVLTFWALHAQSRA